ncbi:hypothetical protein DPEC_G00196640 [Dallia pectoralis]|uniref:Uncharacterized protein n=1 Tax=Dallia pectoralis TaxID=75939 RepID=A0ACC2G7C7_DALPE|nr:hypothetical protein DPEC_G00196640 [Dallia pectoralis]
MSGHVSAPPAGRTHKRYSESNVKGHGRSPRGHTQATAQSTGTPAVAFRKRGGQREDREEDEGEERERHQFITSHESQVPHHIELEFGIRPETRSSTGLNQTDSLCIPSCLRLTGCLAAS